MLTEDRLKMLSTEILCLLHSPDDFKTQMESLVSKAIRRALSEPQPADTQEGIPLQIDPRWKWAAMDADAEWYAYETKPEIEAEGTCWNNGSRDCTCIRENMLTKPPKAPDWRDSLHEIRNGRLVKYVDIPADGEPVWVRNHLADEWLRRVSAGKLKGGELICYADGYTAWTAEGDVSWWQHWRRPTQEELNQ